ncbi:LCP family protein [Clostridium thermarum]|uniref:LCP family protein n=1 Tax=Clostridium thermarum TaxID=1716543 RepID=UPI00111E8C81|nr:LCP family protein [Clostridium thermarum]
MKNFFKAIGNYLKKMSIQKKIVLSICLIFLITFSAIGAYYLHVRSKIYVSANDGSIKNDVDYSDVEMEAPLYEEQKGITNILLIGTDAREIDEPSRSDSIIIATIDDINKNIKFTSIMRDSYVDIPKYKTQKINAAYQLGGPELLMKTIEMNFRIKLDKYILVNFWGFEDIIDTVGGIYVNVKEHELDEINKYIGETREVRSPPLTHTGYQLLDGQQALAYARIRKTDTEYNRTERQREVLGLLAQKLKSTSLINYPKIMESMLGCVRTNIEPAALLNYAYTVSKFEPLEVAQLQIPTNDLSWGGMYNGAWVLLMDRNQNAKVMNDFIFTNKITPVEELDLEAFNQVIKEYKAKEVKVEYDNDDPSLDQPEKENQEPVVETGDESKSGTTEGKGTENNGAGKEGIGTDNTEKPNNGSNKTGTGGSSEGNTGTKENGSGNSSNTGNTGDTGTTGDSGTGSINGTDTGNTGNGVNSDTSTGGTTNGNSGTSSNGTGGTEAGTVNNESKPVN